MNRPKFYTDAEIFMIGIDEPLEVLSMRIHQFQKYIEYLESKTTIEPQGAYILNPKTK